MKRIIANIVLTVVATMFVFALSYALFKRASIIVVPLCFIFISLCGIAQFIFRKKHSITAKKKYSQPDNYLITWKKIVLFTLSFSFLALTFIIICRIKTPVGVRQLLLFSMLISAFIAQFILVKKIYSITTRKIYSQTVVFLLCYINLTFLYAISKTIQIGMRGINSYKDSTVITAIVFIFLLLVGAILIIRKKRKGKDYRDFMKLYAPALLFCFPTIKSITVDDRFYCCGENILKASFDCICPFGYGIISLFIKEYNYCTEGFGYGTCYETRFNLDVFIQIFQHKWLMLHFLSLIVAIAFVRYLNKSYQNKISIEND